MSDFERSDSDNDDEYINDLLCNPPTEGDCQDLLKEYKSRMWEAAEYIDELHQAIETMEEYIEELEENT